MTCCSGVVGRVVIDRAPSEATVEPEMTVEVEAVLVGRVGLTVWWRLQAGVVVNPSARANETVTGRRCRHRRDAAWVTGVRAGTGDMLAQDLLSVHDNYFRVVLLPCGLFRQFRQARRTGGWTPCLVG